MSARGELQKRCMTTTQHLNDAPEEILALTFWCLTLRLALRVIDGIITMPISFRRQRDRRAGIFVHIVRIK